MKKYRWVFLVFIGVGLLLLTIAFLMWKSTRSFIARAEVATGKVVELREKSDSDGSTYSPVVHFRASNGAEITYTESFSGNPPPYDVGESVEVLYLPDDPREARIKGYMSLWLGESILGGMGALFAAIGAGTLFAMRLGQRKAKYLMAYGNAIETDVQGVERNTSIKVNGKSPWRITSQWLDPVSSKLRVFHSENLWFDPTGFVTRKQVTVLLDPANPKRYHMDVSFLPELEGH
jgi:Protein of unknown function (DUF3592)